jgi:N-terminal domain of galactosyltransferase
MDKVSILFPFKSDSGYRDTIFNWVRKYYGYYFPHIEQCIGKSRSKDFSRAQAINDAARSATGEIFIIHDGDIICSPKSIKDSLQLVRKKHWVIPYSKVFDLTKKSTELIITNHPVWPKKGNYHYTERLNGKFLTVGGVNVISRDSFNKVKGFDERFIGWGGEDDAFAFTADRICGVHSRLDTELLHLWHPRLEPVNNKHYQRNLLLLKSYQRCKTKEEIIRMLSMR